MSKEWCTCMGAMKSYHCPSHGNCGGSPSCPTCRDAQIARRIVRVGVATFVFRDDGKFLLGLRKGSHGAGTWGLPGGHIEFGEEVFRSAVREVLEESAIALKSIIGLGWSESVFAEEERHYVTIVCGGEADRPEMLMVVEPAKCAEWRWVNETDLPSPLFNPLAVYLGGDPAKAITEARGTVWGVADSKRGK